MRTLGFVLACVLVMAGSTMAGSRQDDLPGVGTFTYNGSPISARDAHRMIIAGRAGATE
jgi:pseudouridine-5'-phosphate glycosidase